MRFRDFKINEANLTTSSKSSIPAYISAVNDLLTKNTILQVGITQPNVFDFRPDSGQSISSLKDIITGTGIDLNGQEVKQIKVGQLYKSELIKNTAGQKSFNKGEIVEGYHATAAFARLVKRPNKPITLDDIKKIIPNLENGKTFVQKATEIENPIADEFHLTIKLKPQQWNAFKDPKTLNFLAGIIDNVIEDANQETARFAETYEKNGRFDFVRIIGDGVSGETETKTDIRFENETEKKFAEYSLKVGSTKQIHQVGGGAKTASMESRFEILQNELFNVHGRASIADISSIKSQFLKSKNIFSAQKLAYQAAAQSIDNNLKNDNEEKEFLQTLLKALKYWLVRDNEDIKLKQFDSNSTYILNAKKLNDLYYRDDLDLVARYFDSPKSKLPIIKIFDKITNKTLITIRTYQSQGYIRNYIEKGNLFKELTMEKEMKAIK